MARRPDRFVPRRGTVRVFAGVVSCVICAALAGCKRDPAKADPAKADPARTTPSPGATAQNPAPTDSARTTPSPVEERAPLVPREGETKTLQLVALRPIEFALGQQRSDSFDVWSIAEKGGAPKLVVVQGGFTFTQAQPGLRTPLTLETKTITSGPVAAANEIRRLEGIWPDTLLAEADFASFLGARQFSTSNGTFERSEGKWTKVTSLPLATAAIDDAVLAIQDGKLSAYRGTPTVMPVQAKPPADATCATGSAHLSPHRIAARTGAGVVLVGELCRRGPLAVERFAPGKAQGAIETLPDAPKNEPSLAWSLRASVGSAANIAIWIKGQEGAYLAVAREGRAFRKAPLPVPGKILDAMATSDGAVFALVEPSAKGREILFRLVDDVWTRFELPTDVGKPRDVRTVFASDRETAIIGGALSGGDGTHGAALFATFAATLHGKPADAKSVLQLDKLAPTTPAASSSAPAQEPPLFPAFEEGCATPFVYIFDVSKNAPADFVFPSTKKALASFGLVKDITLVELMHRGKRRLGARVKDAATGRALAAHIAANMKDEKPLLVCFAPSSSREISLP